MKSFHSFIAVALLASMITATVIAAEPEKKPEWVSSAGLNFALTDGNAQTLLIGIGFDSVKKSGQEEYLVGASMAFGKNDGNKNVETYRGFGQWNHLFSERWYGFLRAEGMHDGIADVNYRITLSPGAGYYILKDERATLAVEAGPGYVFEKQAGVENDYPSIRIGERYERKLSKTARVWQTAEYLPDISDFREKYILNAEIGIEAALSEKMSLRSVLSDVYNSEPAAGRKKNDVRLVTGITYKF